MMVMILANVEGLARLDLYDVGSRSLLPHLLIPLTVASKK
jgi:hypothetical protein